MRALIGVDIGTTHIKVGVFTENGRELAITKRDNPTFFDSKGAAVYEPEQTWQRVITAWEELLKRARQTAGEAVEIQAVGVAGMAETGLLVERKTGKPRTCLMAWYDHSADAQARELSQREDAVERFCRTGIRVTFKSSLAKVLWLREQERALLDGAAWLGAAEYVVYRLTGAMQTDYSLAGRTGAFQIERKEWDWGFLDEFDLAEDLFPRAAQAGEAVRWESPADETQDLGLSEATRVGVCGHDHVCAAYAAGLAVGGLEAGLVFDSMGTAEAMVGALPEGELGENEFNSGFAYGCHVLPGLRYWMGGLSTSGGAVEWLRGLLGEPALSYTQLRDLLPKRPDKPSGILFFPYLAGSGSPHADPAARAAWVGLAAGDSRAQLYQAVLEGAAFEMEYIRRAAEAATGLATTAIVAAGGGAQNRAWLGIKADVYGLPLHALAQPEATLLGAALLMRQDTDGELLFADSGEVVAFDAQRHAEYQRIYTQGFLALQEALRGYHR